MGRKELADYIGRRTRELNMSFVDLAKISGISRSQLYNILEQKVDPSVDILRRLARGLRVHGSTLIGLMYSDYIRPLNAAGRTEKYKNYDTAWVRDVTFPDNSIVCTNQEFIKTWEIQNAGKEAWTEFLLININNPAMPGYLKPKSSVVEIPVVQPGETIQISVEFKAPKYAGTVISRWKMIDSDGNLVFPDKDGIWCQVEVIDM